ncbi:MAG: HU family DNA-binding protein [Pseudomonadota bacterium]
MDISGAAEMTPDTAPVASEEPGEESQELRKKELVARVAEISGLRKGQVRAAIEATLQVLGEGVAEGKQMNLEPLGKLKVTKERDVGTSNMYVCRLRRKKHSGETGAQTDTPSDEAPLAEAAE